MVKNIFGIENVPETECQIEFSTALKKAMQEILNGEVVLYSKVSDILVNFIDRIMTGKEIVTDEKEKDRCLYQSFQLVTFLTDIEYFMERYRYLLASRLLDGGSAQSIDRDREVVEREVLERVM